MIIYSSWKGKKRLIYEVIWKFQVNMWADCSLCKRSLLFSSSCWRDFLILENDSLNWLHFLQIYKYKNTAYMRVGRNCLKKKSHIKKMRNFQHMRRKAITYYNSHNFFLTKFLLFEFVWNIFHTKYVRLILVKKK